MGFEQEWPPRQEGLFYLIEEKKAGKFLAHNLSGSNQKFNSHCFVPCSYKDYVLASNGDVPERWWKAFQKIN